MPSYLCGSSNLLMVGHDIVARNIQVCSSGHVFVFRYVMPVSSVFGNWNNFFILWRTC